MTKAKKIEIYYYALLREEAGKSNESVETKASTVLDLYKELKDKYHFKLDEIILRVAVNDEFCSWSKKLKSNDSVVFIPPVAGG